MKNAEYWKKRFTQLEDEQYKKCENYIKDIERQFRMAQNSIQADIEKWYYRLAENNDITYSAAKKLLSKNELEEFQWSVEQYIKYGEENAINQKWMKQLENASGRVHIKRLEAMKIQLQQEAEKLYQEYHNGVTDFLGKSYADRYYHTAYEIAKGTGIGHNLFSIDKRKIELVLSKPWAQDRANFSDRIWTNKDKLISTLHTELSQNIIRGEDPYKAVEAVSKKLNTSRNQASTLVYTESAAIAAAAEKNCFEELDIEKYEIVATLDSLTSDICRSMDGKVFRMQEYEVGLTAPPFHPNCRTVTCPYFDDEFTKGEKRAARGEDGKTYYVPADMKYEEWEASFIKGNEENEKKADAMYQSEMPVAKSADLDIMGLSNEEQYALNQYLSFESYKINDKLRNGLELNASEEKMKSNLDSALKKLPKYTGDLSRSLYFGDETAARQYVEKLAIGGRGVFKGYTSTTCADDLHNPKGEIQIIIRNARNGRDISWLSDEKEILYERNTEFKVINIIKQDDTYWIFLEES